MFNIYHWRNVGLKVAKCKFTPKEGTLFVLTYTYYYSAVVALFTWYNRIVSMFPKSSVAASSGNKYTKRPNKSMYSLGYDVAFLLDSKIIVAKFLNL